MRQRIRRSLRISRYVVYRETLVDFKEHAWAFAGSFTGIGLIAFLQSRFLNLEDNLFLIGSFGASAVLVYGVINSPLAQPRNLIGGHLVSALIGVCIQKTGLDILWISAPLAVSLSIVAMQLSKTLHPPGGATALIAVIGSEKVKALGFLYILSPVLSGALILLLIALLVNNIPRGRRYPVKSRFFLKKRRTGSS